MNPIIYSIDLGTTKSRILMAEPDENQPFGLKVLYTGECQSHGVRRGQIYNVDEVQRTINNLVLGAEKKLPKKMPASASKVYCINVNGLSIKASNTQMIERDITRRGHVEESDLKAMVESVEYLFSNSKRDEALLQVLPLSYQMDGFDIVNPIGAPGEVFSARFLTISAPTRVLDVYNNCVPRIKFNQFSPTASAKGRILLPGNNNKCILLIDFGAGVTNLAYYNRNGRLNYEISIPLGADLVTSDIAQEFNISKEDAEFVKKNIRVLEKQTGAEVNIKFKDEHEISINTKKLKFVVTARLRELVAYIESALKKGSMLTTLEQVYVTGGGAHTAGFVDVLKDRLETKQVVVCVPTLEGVENNDLVRYSAVYGMASMYVKNNPVQEERELFGPETEVVEEKPETTIPEKPDIKDDKTDRKGIFKKFENTLTSIFTGGGEVSEDNLK